MQHEDQRAGFFFKGPDEFFRLYVRNVYCRRVDARGDSPRRWARDWWRYPEAFARMEALWYSWEDARLNPGEKMLTWWRDALDPTMTELCSPNGPFWCTAKEDLVTSHTGEPWEVEPMPQDYDGYDFSLS